MWRLYPTSMWRLYPKEYLWEAWEMIVWPVLVNELPQNKSHGEGTFFQITNTRLIWPWGWFSENLLLGLIDQSLKFGDNCMNIEQLIDSNKIEKCQFVNNKNNYALLSTVKCLVLKLSFVYITAWNILFGILYWDLHECKHKFYKVFKKCPFSKTCQVNTFQAVMYQNF